jgi:hypothetical protein
VRVSQLLQMNDEVVALDFDLAATNRLTEYDNEREKRLLEALATGSAMDALSQLTPRK